MLVVICHNTKLEKLTNSILQELHKKNYARFFHYILLMLRNISILCDGILYWFANNK